MSGGGRSWHDLRPRVITGLVLAAVGVVVVWAGGTLFALTAALVAGIIVWEIAKMLAPDRATQAIQAGVWAGTSVLVARAVPDAFVVPVLAVAIGVGVSLVRREMVLFAVFSICILCACLSLSWARDSYGWIWFLWLITTVVMTDIFGYFGGRSIDGPKFWPKVSPSKTWAGIIAGWVAAAVVALMFHAGTDAGLQLVWIAVLLSFASQMGDIAESALKRRAGVKDSSNLLPGHGGVYDRFDGILGGALFMLVAAWVVEVPGISIIQ